MMGKISQKDQQQIGSIQREFQILSEAIAPQRMTKDLKKRITSICPRYTFSVILVNKNIKNTKKLKTRVHDWYCNPSTLLPILLYLFFTNKRLLVKFSWKQDQSDTQNISNQKNQEEIPSSYQKKQDGQYLQSFLKDKKNKNLLVWIDQKMRQHKKQLFKNKQKISFENQKVQIGKIYFIICQQQTKYMQKTFNFVGEFMDILKTLIQNYNIKVDEIALIIHWPYEKKNSSKQIFYQFGKQFWNLVFQIKSVTSIKIEMSNLSSFINPISFIIKDYLNTQKCHQESLKIQLPIQSSQLSIKQGNKLILEEVYRLELVALTQNSIDESSFQFQQLSPLIELFPNLKFLSFHSLTQKQSQTPLLMKNPYHLFKTISESNLLLEVLILKGFELEYQQKCDVKTQKSQKIHQNLQQMTQEIGQTDINLYWLQKMQQCCPYLSGVKLQFHRKALIDQRRLQNGENFQYKQRVKKTKQLMQNFYQRGINNQTFFSTIKVLQSEGFDYETILGVMDRYIPYALV